MRNKRLAALVMAAIMTASSAMPVMAAVEIDGVEIESGKTIGSVKSKEDTESGAAVSVTDGDSVKVKGNVDATDTYNGGVNADNGKVEVSGNVESSEESASYAVDADNKSEVNIKGDVKGDGGIIADNESKVSVGGNVSSNWNPAIDVFNGSSVTVEGNVTSKENDAIDIYNRADHSDTTVTVKGDVVSGDGFGIDTNGNTIVTVTGNVTAADNGVYAAGNYANEEKGIKEEKATVTVGGNITTTDESSRGVDAYVSNVTVGGNVSGQEYGVFAAENSVVQVGGNVTASKKDGCGVSVIESSVTVNGDVSGAYGIEADGGSSVTIKGNVESEKGQLVSIWGSEKTSVIIEGNASGSSELEFDVIGSDNKDSEIAVGGTVKNAEHGVAILVRVDENGKTSNIPEIVVGEIEDINKVEVKNYKTNETVSDEVKQSILDSIKYIVNTNHASVDGKGTITVTKLDGGALDKDGSKTYDVAKATETLTVHVNVQDGYEVSDVKAGKATLTKNSDGSYSVTIPAGGGVNIEAVLKAIEKVKDNNSAGTTVINYSGRDSEGSHSSAPANKWVSSGSLWKYNKSNGSEARNEWQYLTYNGKQSWYFFDADGYMKTGLYTDAKGNQYYLDPTAGAQIGMMATGWVEVNGKWMFFNDGSVADVPVGCYVESMTR